MKWKNLKKILSNRWIISLILFIFSIQVFVPIITAYFRTLEKCFGKEYKILEIKNMLDSFKALTYNKTIGVICFIISLIFIFLAYNIYFTRKQLKNEREGIGFKKKDGTHGTANFTTAEEIEILKIGNEEETPGIVLGETLDTGEIITLPDTCKSINRNVMIWGASGSGKSTSYIIPNALKIAEQEKNNIDEQQKNELVGKLKKLAIQGKNVVCTDPKGELFGTTSKAFKERGYDVKVFNLVSPEHSDGIDLFKFIEKEIDAQVFAQVVISTTQNAGKRGEEFWQNTQENLLKALLLHIKFEVEDKSKKNMRYLNSILASR